ncbi:hypothetical protein SCORR_v1c08230 [Spiroplasma corruscae]|uniref:Uncharacterized protein n=1 Tax=Spiroplasma corruscae TaxID=216934 RepID=A0A222EPW4_9MOLU|nr:hypothetical protein [Spiroplasma corruscae]ASP28595.1 hypothetical protein SCORR_v1c08230 [Spiroplasma corruscae]
MINILADFKNSNQMLIMSALCLLIICIPTLLMYYYFIFYLKTKNKSKFLSKLSFSLIHLVIVFGLICSIISLVFIKADIIDANTDSIIVIAFLVLAFISTALFYFVIFCYSQYIWVVFDGEKIVTLSEKINYSSITKIVLDTNSNYLYINFLEGTRKNRRIKYNKNTLTGAFIIQEIEKETNLKIENIDQKEYSAELEAKSREAVYQKTLDKKQTNKGIKDQTKKDLLEKEKEKEPDPESEENLETSSKEQE